MKNIDHKKEAARFFAIEVAAHAAGDQEKQSYAFEQRMKHIQAICVDRLMAGVCSGKP